EAGKQFYNVLSEDCDLRGTSLYEFFRQQFVRSLVCGESYIAVEFPRVSAVPQTRAEEDALGRSRAYLVDYWPDEVINWSYDSEGNLDWAVIRTQNLRLEKVTDAGWKRVTRWLYYDREDFRIFERDTEGAEIKQVD